MNPSGTSPVGYVRPTTYGTTRSTTFVPMRRAPGGPTRSGGPAARAARWAGGDRVRAAKARLARWLRARCGHRHRRAPAPGPGRRTPRPARAFEQAPEFATATQRRVAAAGQATERDRCAHILRAEIADAA